MIATTVLPLPIITMDYGYKMWKNNIIINHKIQKTYVSASGVTEHETRKAGGFKTTGTA